MILNTLWNYIRETWYNIVYYLTSTDMLMYTVSTILVGLVCWSLWGYSWVAETRTRILNYFSRRYDNLE